ncbi:MAG TPA: leishmanolysin-related zinc metalloendopeptidase [Longimicrobium sp.]|nr:leishmanolysin-related zinc metalloendopeptidase [Longimicrobium sp.]
MRKILFVAASLVIAAGCSDSTDPSVPSTVVIAPTTVSLDAIGATQVVRAAVSDQKGKAMTGVELTWTSSTPSVTVLGAGGDSALVTSVSNGSAVVTARAGDASGTVEARVAQAPARMEKAGGDTQTGPAGAVLGTPLRVQLRDRLGVPVAGQTVTFAVVTGGGAVAVTSAVTGADGIASTNFTVGTVAGSAQEVQALATGLPPVSFAATVTAAAPAAMAALAGNGQTGASGSRLAVAPRVRVTDAFNNPVAGATVAFAVTAGGGSVTTAAQITDAGGNAEVGWTLGAVGAQTLTVTIAGSTVAPVVFTATATGAPGTLTINAGGFQAAMVGTAVPISPSVVVRNSTGAAAAGVTVRFAVTAGGGTVSESSVVTSATGVATLTRWTLGQVSELNTLSVTADGITAAPVVLRGAGCAGSGPAYEITVCITTAMTATQKQAFTRAAARWSTVITGDVASVSGSINEGFCGPGTPSANQTYDDLLIFAAVANIDGPGSVLGQAGPCALRTGATGLPVIGSMEFDVADLGGLESRGQLESVILHEMGHVLGIGTIWSRFGFLQNRTTTTPLDTWYSGPGGIMGFNEIGGSTYTGGQKVPVENTGGGGTANAHWRESVLRNELMTGFLNTGSNPLSILTVRSLADMGYVVNTAAADNFFLSLTIRAPGSVPTLKLHDDLYTGPLYLMGPRGTRQRIR